jgi:ABC-type Mn2+/Zn2+ transport system permease subunit/Mn-dependent DtxR family transcriptional regulator
MEWFEVFQYDWAIRALIASSLVGVMCGILGCFIILRNMALIGDALSHAILPGVVVGFMIAGHSILAIFTGSVVAGLITAVLITLIQRNVKAKEDAAIGIVFTFMFALGVMGISFISRKEGVHIDMKDFLFGNVLGVANQDLLLTSLITLYIIACLVIFYRYFLITTFQSVIAETMGISSSTIHYFLMLLLSFAVVASLQSVGVILVVAMLIIPASCAYLLTDRLDRMLVISGFIGLVSTISGLLLAIKLETTPGPAMTIVATFFYFLSIFFAPKKGLVIKYLIRSKKQRKIWMEDVLKQMLKLSESENLSLQTLSDAGYIKSGKLNSVLRKLSRKDLVNNGPTLTLSVEGEKYATRLVRAHRLWETYLVEKLGLTADQIHEQAEKYEHILTDEFLEKVDRRLGFPDIDPHGSPIPPGKNAKNRPRLAEGHIGQKMKIAAKQNDRTVVGKLWEWGVAAGDVVEVLSADSENLTIKFKSTTLTIPKSLGQKVIIERPMAN